MDIDGLFWKEAEAWVGAQPIVILQHAWWYNPVREAALHYAAVASARAAAVNGPTALVQTGRAHVIEDFASGDDLAELRALITVWQASSPWHEHVINGARAHAVYATDAALNMTSARQEGLVRILGRIAQHADTRLRVQTTLEGGRVWKHSDEIGLHLERWSIYDYQPSLDGTESVEAHFDTEIEGRCLSAALHLWPLTDEPVEGGDFVLLRCEPSERCDDPRESHLEPLYDALPSLEMEVSDRVSYRPGRLVFFTADSLHAVRPVTRGRRAVLFAWFRCAPQQVKQRPLSSMLLCTTCARLHEVQDRGFEHDD